MLWWAVRGKCGGNTWWWPLSCLSPLSGDTWEDSSAPLVPRPGKDWAPPPDRGAAVLSGLCREWAAGLAGKSSRGAGGQGRCELSVSLACLSCRLQLRCLPSPERGSARQGNSPASPVCRERILILFSAAPSCLSHFPRQECQQLRIQR